MKPFQLHHKSTARKSNKKTPQYVFDDSDMDDEIDVFHKQSDIVPLDLDNDAADSDQDNDQHVFDIQNGSDSDEDEDDFEDDTGFAAKIAKQQKSLKAKIGGAADETQDDAEEEENKNVAWGRSKNIYYDNNKGESSEDEEEEEVLRLQNEKMKKYSNADHGLDDEDDSDDEPTLENLSKGKAQSKANKGNDVQDETDTGYEVVMKDPSALSKEEQMEIVYNSAPELVGLLSELNKSVEQLETKVDPVLIKLKEEKNLNTSGIQYLELKKQLLLSYCQAITFHLLLKSEGHPVHDHPVLGRLVEIKNLLDKFLKADSTMDQENRGKHKRQDEQLGVLSVDLLKLRAALGEKLKQKGVFNLELSPKTNAVTTNIKSLNGKQDALDDFHGDTFDIEGNQNKSSNRLSQLVTQKKKPRVISRDDDLPKRDDIEERRRKHVLRVLARAGIQSDDVFQENETGTIEGVRISDTNEDGDTASDTDFYQETKIKRDAKLAAKAQKYSRTAPSVLAAPETLDGKRHINYEMDKNRGLTRKRNKDLKNPRKRFKWKHTKKKVNRKGQVPERRKPAGPYGGEGTGISTISRSKRFKS